MKEHAMPCSNARMIAAIVTVSVLSGLAGLAAYSQDVTTTWRDLSAGKYPQQSGDEIYQAICQGCHMPDGKGAVGAGAYPALYRNSRLAAAAYPLTVVVNGQKAMPHFGDDLTDRQIAEV